MTMCHKNEACLFSARYTSIVLLSCRLATHNRSDTVTTFEENPQMLIFCKNTMLNR